MRASRRRRREQEDACEPRAVQRGREVARLLGRIVDDEHAVDARLAARSRAVEAAEAMRHAARTGWRSPSARPASRRRRDGTRARSRASRRGPTPCAIARSVARWITGPSAIGSENGTPSSMTSAPPRASARIRSTVTSADGSPAAMYGMSAGASLGRAAARSVRRCARRPRRASLGCVPRVDRRITARPPTTMCRSLSPRPDRLTRTIWSCRIVGASFIAYASAWLDSSAGMMPSMRQQSWNAASASCVGRADVLGAPDVLQPRVLGPDARIVEAGRDRMRLA